MASSQSFEPTVPADLIELGHVMSAFGVQGWIKVQPYGDDPTLLTKANEWWLAPRSTPPTEHSSFLCYRIAQARQHSDTIIALPDGFHDRDQAQELRGHTIWLSRSVFPATDVDEYYWADLLGCRVYGQQQEHTVLIGQVSHVFDNGAHAVLVVDRGQLSAEQRFVPSKDKRGRPIQSLVPFVSAHITHIDLQQQSILTTWPTDF